jgi:hypothetical protein
VSRPLLEVADIFHRHGAAWRATHVGHVSLGQLKVMSAIERCRTAALGGHVEACEDCGAGSFTGGFRTPARRQANASIAGIRNPSQNRPFPDM